MEEQAFRRLPEKLSQALVHRMPSMLEYKSLTALDMPEVDVALIEDPDPNCPFGAKEVGQGPLLPVMPALANAIFDAVGVRIDEIPVTPDKVLRALELKAMPARTRESVPITFRPFPIRSPSSSSRRTRAATARKAGRRRGSVLRLPWFDYRAPRTVAEAAKILAGEGPAAMLDRRRHRPAAEHEAPPPDAEGAGFPCGELHALKVFRTGSA